MSPGPDEKRAALLVIALFAMGVGVRTMLHRQDRSPGAVMLQTAPAGERSNHDSLAARSQRLATPLRRGERIDVDVAGPTDLTRLPRIGPALAGRIVADREDRGPFGSLEELGRVSGIGPRVLAELAPHVQFSRPARRPASKAIGGPGISLNNATKDELSQLPGIGPAKAAAIVEYRERVGRFSTVDELARVPGIGRATVAKVRSLIRVR